MTEEVTIIYTHWAMNPERSLMMRRSIESLIKTAENGRIMVYDNGGDEKDSSFLFDLCKRGKIHSYTRFYKNMHHVYTWNDGARRARTKYLAMICNDILFTGNWLKDCVNFLENHEGKYLSTPIPADRANNRPKHYAGEIDGWRLNSRAGSNVFVIRKEDFEKIGEFPPVTGSAWVNRYAQMGYVVAIMPNPQAVDMAMKSGYDKGKPIENLKL